MRISVATRGMAHQRAWGEMLAAGLRAEGHEPVPIDAGTPATTQAVACWGWRVGQQYRDAGHDVLVAERGYFGDRFAYTSLGWNGLNGRADFGPARAGVRRRFGVWPADWRVPHDGRLRVLVLGQVCGDMALRVAGVDYEGWLRSQVARLKAHGHDVFWRPHPQDKGLRIDAHPLEGLLADALAMADVALTFNSNSATDAVLSGVPCWTGDRGAMAWPVTSRPDEAPVTPSRDDWFARLSWCQWSAEEIADGAAVRHILEGRYVQFAAA